MAKVLYERDGRIGRITLNRPEVRYAIDDDLPAELTEAVGWKQAEQERDRGTFDWTLNRPLTPES